MYSVTAPLVVMRPILLTLRIVYQSAPSVPVVMSCAPDEVGSGNAVTPPAGVTRRMIPLRSSVTHRFPSGPRVMPIRVLFVPPTGNAPSVPSTWMRPTALPPFSANHSAPSGPLVMPAGSVLGAAVENSRNSTADAGAAPSATATAATRTRSAALTRWPAARGRRGRAP